jgi:hypothetical protein
MDDMIDLTAGDALLRRRLEAFAETRLSPDPASAARIRARVLAVAHRRADLVRADAALTVLTSTAEAGRATGRVTSPMLRSRRRGLRRVAAGLVAASLGIGILAGTVAAARPGGPLYDVRLWVETAALPSEPSARALAELARLEERLGEASEAAQVGESSAVAAALGAYERIVGESTASAIAAGDAVAAAVLEAGVGRNLAVLQALAGLLPDQAGDAIGRAIDRAIERSGAAIEAIETAHPGRGGPQTNGAAPPDKTSKPAKTDTPSSTSRPPKSGGAPGAASTAKPTPRAGGGDQKPAKPEPTPRKPAPKAP